MIRKNILIEISNLDEASTAINKNISNPIEIELWSVNESGRLFLAFHNASYIIFEKSPDDDIASTPVCRFISSKLMGYEEDTELAPEKVIWHENGGCAKILFRAMFDFTPKATVPVIYDREAFEFSERRFETKNNDRKFLIRKRQVRSYLGKTVEIFMDRPLGYVHKKENYTLTYPVNYGFIPGVIGGDGEELDVYLIGLDEPVNKYTAKIIGIVHRENDNEDKLIAAPENMSFTKEEIAKQVEFQEKYYDSFIETEDSFFECSVKEYSLDRKIPAELEHYLLNKLLCHCEYENFRFPSWKEFLGLDEFKPYRNMDEDGRIISHRPDFICNPYTLFRALWVRYTRINPKLKDDVRINLRFYFRDSWLMMKTEGLE